MISFIPFATYIIGSSPFLPISAAIYGLVMCLTTLSFVTMQYFSTRKKLMHQDVDKTLTHKIYRVAVKSKNKAIASTIIYFSAIPLAYLNVYFAYCCFILPPIIFFIPERIDDEKLA